MVILLFFVTTKVLTIVLNVKLHPGGLFPCVAVGSENLMVATCDIPQSPSLHLSPRETRTQSGKCFRRFFISSDSRWLFSVLGLL